MEKVIRISKKKLKSVNVYMGGKIAEVRANKELTQAAMSDKLKMSRTNYVNMEGGRQGIAMDKLFQIAIIFDLPITYFLPTKEWYVEYGNKEVRIKITYEFE